MASKAFFKRNEGKVMEIEGINVAVYNDSGTFKTFSPICPHLQCDVEWNKRKGVWECPCHGARFAAATGELMRGPAEKGLEPVQVRREMREPRFAS